MAHDGFELIAGHYITTRRAGTRLEAAYFRNLPTDAEAIDAAAACERENGKRQPHQRRIPKAALDESRRRLRDTLPLLHAAATFEELHQSIDSTIRTIPRIGELTVYDTALRIGWRLDLHPSEIHLHAGTRDGAKALGLNTARATIQADELPTGLRKLTPSELEDVLCIYKRQLAEVQAGSKPRLSQIFSCFADTPKSTC